MQYAIAYSPPTPAMFRAARYWIARNVRGLSPEDAGATADLELELWQGEQVRAKAADLLDDAVAIASRRQLA